MEIFLLKVAIGVDLFFVYLVMNYYLLQNVFVAQNRLHLIVRKIFFLILNKNQFVLDKCLTSDGLACIRFVEHNDLYWHSDCCVCVTCLQSLIGKKYYQDQIYNQLFCLEHIPHQYL